MNRIKELRTQNKIKQIELAEHLNVAQNTLSNWETGRSEPDIETLTKISEYFNVTIDYVLERTDFPTNSMNRIKELREKNEIKQIDLIKELNVSQGTLSNWERGVHDPDNESLIKLSEIFDVSLDYLLCKTDDPTPPNKKVSDESELIIPDVLKDVKVAFHRGEFEDLTQDEVDALAMIAKTLKAQRKL